MNNRYRLMNEADIFALPRKINYHSLQAVIVVQ